MQCTIELLSVIVQAELGDLGDFDAGEVVWDSVTPSPDPDPDIDPEPPMTGDVDGLRDGRLDDFLTSTGSS